MPVPTVGAGEPIGEPALRFDHVSKVFCDSLILARKYAIHDTLKPRRDRPSRLRPGERVVLRDISFELRPGETLLVLGTSGSGKSALADLITGRWSPDTGTILRRGSVGVIGSGKYGQNAMMQLREYVRLMAALQGVQAADLDRTCEAILEWTDLGEHANTMVFDLPRKVLKPVSIVGSLLAEHDIYVFDDFAPFGDNELERRLAARLDEIFATRTSIVVGRGPHVPRRVDHAMILHAGEIVYWGKPDVAIPLFDRFADQIRTRLKRRNAASARSKVAHQRATGSVEEATALIRELLGAAGPDWAIDKALARLSELNLPFVVGPCLSNTSWEVLFWLPFVKWMRRQLGASPPAVALSRNAVGLWYARVAGTYVDVYDLVSPSEFEALNSERARETSSLKQISVSSFDRELMQKAAAKCGLSEVEALHPSLLLALAAEIWRGRLPISELGARAIYERLPVPDEELSLPQDYVAVCFDFTKHFPENPSNRALVTDVVRVASERSHVVVMGPHEWMWSDGHLQDNGDGIELIHPALQPRRHRSIQAAVVGRARAAIGSLNGPITCAPFFGVPAICLHPPTGGLLEFHTGVLRQAAEHLGDTVLLSGAMGTLTPGDMRNWLDDVLEGRSSSHIGVERA